jgi:N-methylhydantoinase B
VQFRQYCCPGCFTAISTAVVPVDHVDDITRASRVLADAGR